MEPPADGGHATAPGCANCGAPYEADQEYCLECGARLPARRDARPPSSLIAVAIILALLAIGGLVAGIVLAGGGGSDEAAPVATGALETTITGPATQTFEPSTDLPPATDAGTGSGTDTGLPPVETTLVPGGTNPEPPGTATTPPPDTPTTSTPTTPPSAGEPTEWPAGQSGYTVIVASIPQSQGAGAAEAQADRARQAGLPQVGVLVSSDYSSLRPGFYVVFSGVYSTLDEAKAALPAARSAGFSDAYTRRITQ